MTLDEIETLLNHDSGMKGMCGVSDMREAHRLANGGDMQARLAIEMYCYRICKYIGAYYTILGGLDALVFTAGIGENDSFIRQSICTKLATLGIAFDQQRNLNAASGKVKVLIIPANEELEIARQTVAVIRQDCCR